MSGSRFAERLERLVALSDAERRALDRLEDSPRTLRRGATVVRENDRADEIYIVRSGWLMSHVILNDGSRQILRLHLPGEMIGTASTAFSEAPETLVTLGETVLCPFDKALLRAVFEEHPRLAAFARKPLWRRPKPK